MSARVRVGGGDTDISDLRVIGNSIEVRALNVGIRNLRTLRADLLKEPAAFAVATRVAGSSSRWYARCTVVEERRNVMLDLLWALAAIFVVLWILGFAMNFTAGGLLHVLLVLAVAAVLFRIIAGRSHSHA